jgi:hypothetical protein
MKNNRLNEMLDGHPLLLYRAMEHDGYRTHLAQEYCGTADLKRLDEDLQFYTHDRFGDEPYKELLQGGAEGSNGKLTVAKLKLLRDKAKKTKLQDDMSAEHLKRDQHLATVHGMAL